MLSQTVEYALRAASHLAYIAPEACTTQQLSEKTCVPTAYLAKVLQSLTRAGIVRSRRGVGGGVALAAPPEDTTMLQVVRAVDSLQRIESCPLRLESHGARLCPLHRRLDSAIAYIEAAFGDASLAELLNHPDQPTPLCEVSVVADLAAKSSP